MSRPRLQPQHRTPPNCRKVKHVPLPGVQEEVMQIGGNPYVGRVCKTCLTPYMDPLTEEDVTRMRIIRPS
jgi:hypothetical protein